MKQATAPGEFAPLTGYCPGLHGDSATHDMLNIHPSEVRADDFYKYGGRYLTVYKVLELTEGGIALYFAELVHGAIERAVINEGTPGVTVYRPKDTIADA